MTCYQISFSGGMGSAVTALVALEKGLDFNLIFADTLIEDEDLYRFNDDITRACGKDIITLRDGRTPWDVYIDKRWIGNTRTAHCSTELKTKPVMRWLAENSEPDDPLVLGMDWSEIDRIERAGKNWHPRPVVSLLVEYGVTRADFEPILKRHNVKKPRLYQYGYEHNNCGGFCCKAGLVQFERLYRTDPERYAYHEKEMNRALNSIGTTAKPFLRKTTDGKLEYLTLTEFRLRLEAGTIKVPKFDAAGCGCFTDE
jgi:3'-phosphoadenosine 5'-phosphosulfate sulfotransferase (PAPS reductase)/FAD synthetase